MSRVQRAEAGDLGPFEGLLQKGGGVPLSAPLGGFGFAGLTYQEDSGGNRRERTKKQSNVKVCMYACMYVRRVCRCGKGLGFGVCFR